MKFCSNKLLAMTLCTIVLVACGSIDVADDGSANPNLPRHYVSKIELTLKVSAINDLALGARVQDALRDIEFTFVDLQDTRLSHAELAKKLRWTGPELLLLPPESDLQASGNKHFRFVLVKVEDWQLMEADALSFVATFRDAMHKASDVRERQTYRKLGTKWRLVRQERL